MNCFQNFFQLEHKPAKKFVNLLPNFTLSFMKSLLLLTVFPFWRYTMEVADTDPVLPQFPVTQLTMNPDATSLALPNAC